MVGGAIAHKGDSMIQVALFPHAVRLLVYACTAPQHWQDPLKKLNSNLGHAGASEFAEGFHLLQFCKLALHSNV